MVGEEGKEKIELPCPVFLDEEKKGGLNENRGVMRAQNRKSGRGETDYANGFSLFSRGEGKKGEIFQASVETKEEVRRGEEITGVV